MSGVRVSVWGGGQCVHGVDRRGSMWGDEGIGSVCVWGEGRMSVCGGEGRASVCEG